MKRKKIGQRIGALILSVALLFSSIPADIHAAEVVPVIQEEQLEESIPAEVPEEKQPEEGVPAGAPEEKQPEEGAPAEAPEEKQPEEGAPAEAPEEKQPEESTPAEVPEEKQPEEGAPAEVPEEKQLEEGTSAEVPEEKQLEEETPADKGKDQTVEADQDSSTAESEALLEADQEEASEKSEQPWEISVTDEEGNTLAVTLDDIEDPEKLINEIDFSQTSGKLVWFKNISVDHEGAIEVEIQVPDQDDLEGKVVKAIHFPEDGELEYIDAETEGDMVSFTLNSLSPVAVYVAEDLYHYAQEDIGSIITWRETYIPNGYEDLLTYPDSWWDSLYDYERDLADFLKGLIVELSDDIYMDQDLDECISILESGIDASTFFEGTLYSGLNLEDLHNLQRFGYSLDDVYEFWMAACGEESESDLFYEYIKQIDADEIDEDLEILAGTVEKIMPVNPMLYVSNGDLVAKMSVSSTGYSGTGHGTIYKLTVGGQPSLCLSMGKSARSTYLYNANPGTYEQKNDGLGYLISRADLSGSYYVCVQIAAWLYMQSSSYSKTQVEQRATAMLNISSEEDLEAMVSTIWNNYYGATQNSKSYYVFHSDNANSQDVGLPKMPSTIEYTGGGGGGNEGGGEGGGEYATASVSATAEDSVEVDAKVTVTKHDSITDEVLSGAKIRINGSSYTSGEDGSVTHKEEDEYEASATGPSYTYVVDWGSLDAEQKADADSKGYYHSYDAAYSASWGEANQQVQDELDEWAHDWRCDFSAKETDPPYGYCNNDDNTYDTTCKDGQHKYHDFYNKPWEAWLKVTKHDSITGQTDFSLADADFHVYEYNKETGEYELYRYSDRQLMVDNRDGTYNVGPLYYNPRNEGKFMILETESPFGYTIDQTLNRFYFEITGEEQITYTNGNQYNSAGTYVASQSSPHDFKAYNEPWKVKVDVIKVDENTGELLSGVKFDILRFNRDTNDYDVNFNKTPNYIKVNEQADQTYLSEWVYWNYQNQGKFYLVETTARKGYFSDWKDRIIEIVTGHPAGWQDDDANGKTAYYFQITGSRTEEGVVEGYNSQTTLRASSNNQGTITNERTKGRVTVKKLDTESESQIVQGDTTLDGAVYELRAAADITHADGHTGVIYKKGDLVMTGTVGKTPVTDKNGYVLNTAGKRYITYGGEIQYKDTPGEFSFYNIELGKYTLKEVKASEGYMLDETTYNLTFTYDDETQRVILRDETSSADKNTLTMDNQDKGNEIIYTGEHVQKKAFSMVKTSDNQFQTELVPVAGAGFSVYLVSELAGVRNGSIAPVNGTSWSGADILNFYDYDFTQDKTATVYKRSLEAWTAYDRMWLQAVSGGNANEYRVKEMFTDSNGALTSPELPYGTYVVVETTTPEKHVMARPFFVYVTDDGGVVYTDATRQTIKESFSEKKDIRFGDHNNSKVYKDPSAYNANAIEGRVPQALRYISDNRTESYLRLVKADSAFLPSDGTILKPEEMVAGTVLKEGSSYRIKIVNMSDREYETFLSTGWKKDADGYIWYYETSSRKEYGTAACPFDPTVLRNGEGKIIDCYLTLPAKLPTGSYEITELHAPSGYVLNGEEDTLEDTSIERLNTYQVTDTPADPIQFVIDNNSVYPDGQMGENKYTLTDSYGNVTCTVFQDNKEQKGILELTKHGEKLYGASDQDGTALKDKIDNVYFRQIWNNAAYTTKDQIFEYKDAPIEGAVFDIYAAEDIYTQELDASMLEEYGVDVSEYLVWSKDDKISTITTDKTGYAYLADLYIGKYYIKEVTAGDGFVLNEEIQEFEITAQEEHVNFEWVSSDYENQRQKIYLEAEKQDVETHEPLPGAIYGLYNKNDIYSYIMDNPDKTVPDYRHVQKIFDYINIDDGRLLIPADTLIATAVTDETGIAVFDEDLPLGEYYINELEAPLGYTTSDIVTDVDATYAGSYGS